MDLGWVGLDVGERKDKSARTPSVRQRNVGRQEDRRAARNAVSKPFGRRVGMGWQGLAQARKSRDLGSIWSRIRGVAGWKGAPVRRVRRAGLLRSYEERVP